MRSPDRFTIPLCADHHRELHAHGGENKFFSGYGIDAKKLAKDLWDAPDPHEVQRIVQAAWSKAYLERSS